MKKLDFYVLRELAVPFIIGTAAVVLMFQANLLIALFKNLNLSGVPADAVAQLVLFKTPYFLNQTLPVGTALATSLAFTRLARESELTALRSAGIPILRVVRPALVLGLFVAIANFVLVEKLMPPAERAATKLSNQIGVLALSPQFKANVVINLRNYVATFGSVQRGKGSSILLTDIMLMERRAGGETVVISSPGGTYSDGEWKIREPYLRLFKGKELLSAESAKPMVIDEKISVQDFFQAPQPEEKTMLELRQAIAQARKNKLPTDSLETAYQVKFSVPASCLIFALTGPVFAIRLSRAGPFVGVLLSIILVMLYFNAFVISTQILGRNGWVSPFLAAWSPNIVFAVFAYFMLRRSE